MRVLIVGPQGAGKGTQATLLAENLGVPTETIRSRLRYATSTLRAALEADTRTTSTASRERMA